MMINEMRFSKFHDTGEELEQITLDQFVTGSCVFPLPSVPIYSYNPIVYVNHRPVMGVGSEDVSKAFKALGAEAVTTSLGREQLIQALQSYGMLSD